MVTVHRDGRKTSESRWGRLGEGDGLSLHPQRGHHAEAWKPGEALQTMCQISPGTSRSPVGCGALANEDGCLVYLYTGRRFSPIRLAPDSREGDSPESSELYEVRIIDNEYNTYDEVIQITMLALAVDRDRAFAVAWEVDHRGYCVVAHAPRPEAEAVAGVIRIIGIEVQVNPVVAGDA